MALVNLTGGHVAIVDDADLPIVSTHRWKTLTVGRSRYAVRNGAGGKAILMHRLLLNPDPEQLVDHINHNGLDNRRANLRACTAMQNQWNRKKHHGSSRFKGVHWNSREKAWHAQIRVGGQSSFLGYYATQEDAAAAYDRAAETAHGEFACLNGQGGTPQRLQRPQVHRKGSSTPLAKITESDVVMIRLRLMAGRSAKEIAASLGVSPTLIWNVRAGKNWTHVTGPEGWKPSRVERRTACAKGHEYTDATTQVRIKNGRRCLVCARSYRPPSRRKVPT